MPIDSTTSPKGRAPATQYADQTTQASDDPAQSPQLFSATPIAQETGRGATPHPIEQPGNKRPLATPGLQYDAEAPTPKRLKPDHSDASMTMRELFQSHLPAAKQIIDYGAHLSIQQDAGVPSLRTQELLQAASEFYQNSGVTEAGDDAKIQEYLQVTQPLLETLEQKANSNDTPCEKLHWFLERASQELDTEYYVLGNRDMLITDGKLSKAIPEHKKEMISAKSKLALSYALKQLPQVDWLEAPTTLFGRHQSSKAECLEKIVSLKTILNNTDALLETDVNELVNIANNIHAPTLAQQRTEQTQHNQAMQQFMQNFQQAAGAFFGGQAGAANPLQNFALLGGIPPQPRTHTKDYQTKMRCYTAAAGALLKFGNADQKSEALALIDKVKALYAGSKAQVYNLNYTNSMQTSELMRQANESQTAHNHDTLICKALCVEIAAGGADTALNYLATAFDATTRRTELLLNLIDVTETASSVLPKDKRAQLFQQPLNQLSTTILDDDRVQPATKSSALRYIAEAFTNMGLNQDAEIAYDHSIDCLTESTQQAGANTHWSDGSDSIRSLMSSLQKNGHEDKIRAMIDRQPEEMRPELLAIACELIHRPVFFEEDNRTPNQTVRGFWADAKSIARNLPNPASKARALLTLSDPRYASLHQENESEEIIASVRAMNDGSTAFRDAFRPFEYRVGRLD